MIEPAAISEIHIDALKEISNIGLGNAATALAELLNKKVDMAVPKATFLEVEQIFPLLGGLEEVVACVSLSVEGDVPGAVMFVFTEQSTYKLVDMLMGYKTGTTAELDDMGESAVMEIGNVLTGSFINAIGGMTGLRMNTSVPMFAFDMLGAVLSSFLVASGHWEDRLLLIETLFFQEQDEIKGHFFLLPETGGLERLFEALGMPAEC
ncbi:MAG TPA: chemotaxis protein CheC [Bacillota bacterium]|nr:chemotaxis protein CheC [Bacillota bacterium]